MSTEDFIDIEFGNYMPDLGGAPSDDEPGYLVDLVGLRPTPHGYRSAQGWEISGSSTVGSLATTVGSAAAFSDGTTNHFFFVNNSHQIFESRNEGDDTWENVSPAAGTINALGDFVLMGGDAIYISSSRAPISKSLSASHATLFASLAGSPPTAVCGAQVGQHLVLGNLVGTDIYAFQTSAIGDHTDWPTPDTDDAIAKESIRETLPQNLGPVRAVLGGEKIGIVMQSFGLTRITYQGGNAVYSVDTYEKEIGYGLGDGTVCYSQPVTDGKYWYWFNEFGVWRTDGYSVESLSEGKINESLFRLILSHPDTNFIAVGARGAFDPHTQAVMWGGNSLTTILGYDTRSGTFFFTDTVTMGMLGPFAGNSSTAIGGFGSGRALYSVASSSRRLTKMESSSSTFALQTGFIEIEPGYVVNIHNAHVLGGLPSQNYTMECKGINSLASVSLEQSGFTTMTAQPLGQKRAARISSQYVSFRISGITALASLIRGIRVYYSKSEPGP